MQKSCEKKKKRPEKPRASHAEGGHTCNKGHELLHDVTNGSHALYPTKRVNIQSDLHNDLHNS